MPEQSKNDNRRQGNRGDGGGCSCCCCCCWRVSANSSVAAMQLLIKCVYSSLPYNPNTGELESTGHTKAELNANQPRGGELHDRILLQVSNILGLSKDGKPHPCLGTMSSPRHEDHPLVWRYWLKHVATQLPRG